MPAAASKTTSDHHPALDGSGNPVGNIPLQQLDTSFASAKRWLRR